MEALAKKLQGKVQFAFVYTQEVHPDTPLDALPGSPIEVIPALSPTLNWTEREQRAREFQRVMKGGVRRMLIDVDEGGEDGSTRVQCLYHMKRFGGRNFVIDRNRHVVTITKIEQLYQRLPELFPNLASDLKEDEADRRTAELPAEE